MHAYRLCSLQKEGWDFIENWLTFLMSGNFSSDTHAQNHYSSSGSHNRYNTTIYILPFIYSDIILLNLCAFAKCYICTVMCQSFQFLFLNKCMCSNLGKVECLQASLNSQLKRAKFNQRKKYAVASCMQLVYTFVFSPCLVTLI